MWALLYNFRWRVTATRASAPRESAFQLSAIGFGFPWLAPERPEPELLVSVAVTRHLIICPPANHPVSGFPLIGGLYPCWE